MSYNPEWNSAWATMRSEYGKLMCMICIEKNKQIMASDISKILQQETYDRVAMEEHLLKEHTILEVITTLREVHWTMMK